MNDIEYTLTTTNRERKNLANQARHKKGGSRSKKCTLPSDYLSAAQKKGLNGEVTTYEMDKPHTLSELRQWPEDIRKEYMANLVEKYGPTNVDLAEMFGCNRKHIHRVLPSVFGIDPSERNMRSWQNGNDAWASFLGVEPTKSMWLSAPRLRETRIAQGLTQTELAKKSGVSSASISMYETSSRVRPDRLTKLAAALGTSVEYLTGDTDDPGPTQTVFQPDLPQAETKEPAYDSFKIVTPVTAPDEPDPAPTIITPPNYLSFVLDGTVEDLIQLLETGKAMFNGKYSISVTLQRTEE